MEDMAFITCVTSVSPCISMQSDIALLCCLLIFVRNNLINLKVNSVDPDPSVHMQSDLDLHWSTIKYQPHPME
jgi:hypothetical protein